MTATSDGIVARVSQLQELNLRVAEDPLLGCINVDVIGLQPGLSCILAPPAALDLAIRLTGACARLRKIQLDQPPAGSPGPFSARF